MPLLLPLLTPFALEAVVFTLDCFSKSQPLLLTPNALPGELKAESPAGLLPLCMRLLAAIIIIMPPALPGDELPWPKLLPGEEDEEKEEASILLGTDGGVDGTGAFLSRGGDLLVRGVGREPRSVGTGPSV